MKKLNLCGILLWLFSITACTSISEGEGTLPPNPDLNRRVIYSGGTNQDVRRQMYEQSSDINRVKNIEETNRNGPATTPPAMRVRRLPDAPVDSTRHNVQVPVRHKVPVN